ncbi:MAG: hypothetical protein CM1200mP4_1100 [Rhodospirillaceae bacterium]|nr:MAG: hypothetical protein CM1200mP4_1100 [Rhodospirillaceae bacterium]
MLCDWIFAIALIRLGGPPAKPIRQPVIAYAFDTPLTVKVLGNSSGVIWGPGVVGNEIGHKQFFL